MTKELADFLNSLEPRMEAPTSYGWFHLLFFIGSIIAGVLLCVFCRNCKEKTFRRIMLISAIVIILMEVYKQVIFAGFKYNKDDPAASNFSYDWYAFPFQFCATPQFVFPLLALLPNKGKVSKFIYDGLLGFTMTFILFGGLVTMIYPEQVFCSSALINIQTMIHHGSMISLGIFTFAYKRKEADYRFIWKSVVIFLAFIAVASILNSTLGLYCKSIGHTFNMFFISPHFPCTLPVLDGIYQAAPYPLFLFAYVGGFTVVGAIVFSAEYWIYKLIKKSEKKKTPANP